MKTRRYRGFQGGITLSAAKGDRLDSSRALRMASVAGPPAFLAADNLNVQVLPGLKILKKEERF